MRTVEQRFWQKVNKDGPVPEQRPELGKCWMWTAATNKKGYGEFWLGGQMRRAHRISFEFENGPIPDGLEPDHLCRVHPCVRPSHLEVVTSQINCLRGIGPTALNAKKTHCLRGHPLSGDNLLADKQSRRICRECHRQKMERDARAHPDRVREYNARYYRKKTGGTA